MVNILIAIFAIEGVTSPCVREYLFILFLFFNSKGLSKMITPLQLKNSKIAVFGLGKAGMSTVNALVRAEAELYVWDDGEASREKLKAENLKNVYVISPEETPWTEVKFLALSPGIPLTHNPHKVVQLARTAGCPIVCDIEFLYNARNDVKFLGITGTNGKSTTTALTGHILNNSGIKAEIGGNIGIPALDLAPLEKDSVYVMEMSSYQLDLIDKTHFNVSILLNVTPDHLDRHGDMQGYIDAKFHIFDNQGKDDYAIIGVDCDNARKVYEKLKLAGKIGHIIPISTKYEIAGGITVKDGFIYDNTSDTLIKHSLGKLERIPGEHNCQNVAAAFAACIALGAEPADIIPAIQSFPGLKHRIQLVAEVGGVKFINDSKATNADAVSNALRAFDKNIYWIIGGLSKEGGIAPLAEFFPKIHHAFLIGKAQDDFASVLEGKVKYTKCETLACAFDASANQALNEGLAGAVVLLSPACASWDQWASFEARGDAFCEMAMKIKNSK